METNSSNEQMRSQADELSQDILSVLDKKEPTLAVTILAFESVRFAMRTHFTPEVWDPIEMKIRSAYEKMEH